MCKAAGKVPPRFEPEWNDNAQLIQELRVELTPDGVYRLDETGHWLYRNAVTKTQVIARFPQLELI